MPFCRWWDWGTERLRTWPSCIPGCLSAESWLLTAALCFHLPNNAEATWLYICIPSTPASGHWALFCPPSEFTSATEETLSCVFQRELSTSLLSGRSYLHYLSHCIIIAASGHRALSCPSALWGQTAPYSVWVPSLQHERYLVNVC